MAGGQVVDALLGRIAPHFDATYAGMGAVNSVRDAPQAQVLIALYIVRSERLFCERPRYDGSGPAG